MPCVVLDGELCACERCRSLSIAARGVIGLVCGNGLEMSILKLLESDQLRFEHEIQWNGCLYSALITIFFTTLVSVPVLRKIKHLQLTDMTS